MRLLSIDRLNLASPGRVLPALAAQQATDVQTHHSLDLLQRTQRGEEAEDRPDERYWTAYDHFMVEREARGARNAYLFGVIAEAMRGIVGRFHRRRKLATADGARGS